MNWLKKIANYFEEGTDWGSGPQMELKDKLFELFKVEYVIGELKRRAHMNKRLQYNKRYAHWLNQLEEHAWELASEQVGPEVLAHLQKWMEFHSGSGFADEILGIDESGNVESDRSSIREDGSISIGGGFEYQLRDEVVAYFLSRSPGFVQQFMTDEIESRTQNFQYDPEMFPVGERPEDMAQWDSDRQLAYIVEHIQESGFDFQQLRDWLSEWGNFDAAVAEVIQNHVYPKWREFWGDKIVVAEDNVNGAIQRLDDALRGSNLGNLLATINLALNAQHVHGGMYEHMDLDVQTLEGLSNLNTDELDEFVNMITGEQWTTASWLTRVSLAT